MGPGEATCFKLTKGTPRVLAQTSEDCSEDWSSTISATAQDGDELIVAIDIVGMERLVI
jgi:hypothetical protein